MSTPSAEGTGVLGQPAVSFSASVDVLILGSGVAGLSAAMDPAEAGLSVMAAEKLDVLGGESYESNAVMDVVGSKVQKDAGITESCDDVWPSRRETLRAAGVTDLDFAKRLFYAAPEWVDRMRDSYGAQFAEPRHVHGQRGEPPPRAAEKRHGDHGKHHDAAARQAVQQRRAILHGLLRQRVHP